MAKAFSGIKGGLGISIVIVGALLAASTGIVGATVVTMGLMSLPALLKEGYDKKFSSGLVAATGTLGQIIPPSIALVLLGDVMSNAYQRAQNDMGIFSVKTVSVGDLFIGALLPGLIICILFLIYTIFWSRNLNISSEKESKVSLLSLLNTLLPPILLIFMVLGSIIFGIATPTEAAGVGAIGSILICLYFKKLNMELIKEASRSTALVTTMVFTILIGASIFSLIFRGVGGDELISLVFELFLL